VVKLLGQHWFCIVPLLPFIVMLSLHQALGMSDDMLGHVAGTRLPAPAEIAFNYIMVLVFFLGIAGFLAHSFSLARSSTLWLIIKLAALAAGWSLFIFWVENSRPHG
jgi:hypothetical protein